jgi:hypothetical protein
MKLAHGRNSPTSTSIPQTTIMIEVSFLMCHLRC